jgi:methanogenic corrinoid protein MtbC1
VDKHIAIAVQPGYLAGMEAVHEGTRGRYPIRVVAKLTGIPIDTLRAWERRYGAVAPGRDDRGRLYADRDLHKLRLLRQLIGRGHAIGRIAGLPEPELEGLLAAGEEGAPVLRPGAPVDVGTLLASLERYDQAGMERQLGRIAAVLSPGDLVREVVVPFLRRVGEGWHGGALSVAQEHMATAAMRNLLGSLMRLQVPREGRPQLVFATPPGERHDVGIMAAAMLAAFGGLGVIYLGADLPTEEVVTAVRRTGARAVVLGITGAEASTAMVDSVRRLAADLPRGVALLAGGMQPPELAREVEAAGAQVLPDFDALEEALRRLGARP